MTAGRSANAEAEASARRAEELRAAADAEARRAQHFLRGGAAELTVARLLGELTAYDVHVLHDRRWPGTRTANIDHLVIASSGVFVVDTKDWSGDVFVRDGVLWRGQLRCDDEVEKAHRMAEAVREELVDEGLPPTQVLPVLVFNDRDFEPVLVDGVWVVGAARLCKFILVRGKLLTQLQIEQLVGRLMVCCPPATSMSVPIPPQPSVTTETAPDESPTELFTRAQLDDAALEAAMRAPLPDWMTFLHPSQARLVKRSFVGPARISGPAGTGKSVVALHRLAYLAERRRNKLLYVTFVKTVPRVYAAAFARLSPHAAGRVEFTSLHSWAYRFLRERGRLRGMNPGGIDECFRAAWAKVAPGTFLESSATVDYWRQETDNVIRGRSLASFDQYMDLERVGRGSRLGAQQRRAVWRLVEAYQTELRERKLHDWNDVLRLARDEVRRRPPNPGYDVVVLDEAQDMPLVAAELLHALVGDAPDGLLLVGDDQQRVFAGGFRLSEAGIDVTGRSTKLTLNYRNTRAILRAARSLVAGEDDDLLEGVREAVSVDAFRDGDEPVFVRAETQSSHDAALASHLRKILSVPGVSAGDVAVLVQRRRLISVYRAVLERSGVPSVELSAWDGRAAAGVIVGTSKSAKGLDFKHVIVPSVDRTLLQPTEPEDEYAAERWRLSRRELYVAMTRARDSLWVGVVAPRKSVSPIPQDLRVLKSRAMRLPDRLGTATGDGSRRRG